MQKNKLVRSMGTPTISKSLLKLSTLTLSMMCLSLAHAEETESSEAVEFDVEAVAWAYGKCVALGLENGSMESAMMMDRLKMMLGGY